MARFRGELNNNPYREAKDFEVESVEQQEELANVGGSAKSKAFYQEKDSRELWFAKSEVYEADNIAEQEAFLEYCANKIYAYYGVTVARLAIAVLPSNCNLALYGLKQDRKTATHLLSRWVDRFNPYGYLPKFFAGEQNFILKINEQEIPERGLGHILAVAYFINDIDVIGGSGKNIGYQLRSNTASGLYALSCKIDPGNAFWGFRRKEEEKLGSERRKIRIVTNGAVKDVEIDFGNLSKQTREEFIATINDIITTPDSDLSEFFRHSKNLQVTIDEIVDNLKQRKSDLKETFTRELQETQLSETTRRLQGLTLVANNEEDILSRMFAINLHANNNFLYKQAKEFYIEFSTASQPYEPNGSQERLLLPTTVETFLQSEAKILTLLGDGGTGKTTVSQKIRENLWYKIYPQNNESAAANCWVPIYIELKRFSKRTILNCILNTLKDDYKLRNEQIETLKAKHKFLFILDGFDEIEGGLKCNLWEANKLSEWPNVKILITSRIDYLKENDLSQYFTIAGQTNITRYLLPFNNSNIIEFLCNSIGSINQQFWNDLFEQQPHLTALLRVPLLLKIFKEAWPTLKDKINDNKLTRFALYKLFIQQWFFNNNARLSTIIGQPVNKEAEFSKYSIDLALTMYAQNKLNINRIDTNEWSKFFNSEDKEVMQARLGCPLRKSGEEYSFIHKTFLEYFVARILWDLCNNASKEEFFKVWSQRNVTEEPGIISFLVDCFNSLGKRERESLAKKMKDYIRYSAEKGEEEGKAASGIASFLNTARVCFSGENFAGVKLRGADLTGAILDSVNLKGADLRDVRLKEAWLQNANLANSNMEGAIFGELSYKKLNAVVIQCKYSPDGKYFAATTESIFTNSKTTIYKVEKTGGLTEVYSPDQSAYGFQANSTTSPNGQYSATINWNNIKLYKTDESGKRILVNTLTSHTRSVNSVTFSPDNQWLASGSRDNAVRFWSLSDTTKNHTLTGHTDWVNSVTFSPDNQWFASGSGDKTVRLWSLSDPTKTYALTGHTDWVLSVTFSPDNQWLASGSSDKTIRLWSLSDPAKNYTLTGHTRSVNSVTFSPDNQWLASGSRDNTVRFWSLSDSTKTYTLTGHTDWVNSVTFSSDNQWLASGSGDNTVRLWSLSDSTKTHTLTGHTEWVLSVSLSPDNQWLASGSGDNTVRLWSLSDPTKTHTLTGHTRSVNSVTFSPDNQWLASGSRDNTVRFWSLSDPTKNYTLTGHTDWVNSVTFSPDNQWLASGSGDNTVRLWSLSDSTKTHTLTGHTNYVNSVNFSPDNQWLASGSRDNTVRLWSLSDSTKTHTLTGHTDWVNSVTFSPDNQWLASGSTKEIIFWSRESLSNTHFYSEKFIQPINFNLLSLAYKPSPDHLTLAAGGGDCSVRLFEQRPNDELILLWTSTQTILSAEFTDITAARLSATNAELLTQRGATGVAAIVEELSNPKPLLFFKARSSRQPEENQFEELPKPPIKTIKSCIIK